MNGNSEKAEILNELSALVQNVRPAAALNSGKPVLGYFCCYVPPELLLAAGLYPLRLTGLGVEDSSSGDAYLSHLTCSFCRHVTAAVLDGQYDFLAGQISLNTCDHVRRAHDVLVQKSSLSYHGFLTVPRSLRPGQFYWYVEELERLKQSLENHFSVHVTNDALNEAIQQMNQVRDRIQKLDALRRNKDPRLKGSDMLTVTVAARILPAEKFTALADRLFEAAKDSEPITDIRGRLVLTGGPLDDPRFIRALESQGAHIAGDLFCFGTRGLGQMIEPGANPLEAIARSYLEQIPCARMMGEFPGRYQALMELYQDCHAAGIVFQRLKFCQVWSGDAHNLKHRLQEDPKPLLVLDREYGTVSTGQLKTRIQAFLEKIAGREQV